MEENIYIQIYIFLFTLYGGLMIGIIYDLIDILLNGHRRRNRGKLDLFFWLVAIIIILSILFYSNDGIVRVYTLLGFAVGWIIYFWLLSKLFQKVIRFFIQAITMVLRFLLSILLLPYKWLQHILYKPYIRLNRYLHIPNIILTQFKRYKKYIGKKD